MAGSGTSTWVVPMGRKDVADAIFSKVLCLLSYIATLPDLASSVSLRPAAERRGRVILDLVQIAR